MKKMWLLTTVIVMTAILAGCGLTKAQKEGIGAFGHAAVSTGTAGKEAFTGGRENVMRMKRLRLAIERKQLTQVPGKQPDREFYGNELDLDSGLDPDNIKKRVDAAELLVQYGNLLVAFSEETQEKELAAAAARFTDSVASFPDNPLTADEINGLGQIVIVGGRFWVEHEKKEALKKIIPFVSPLVSSICGVLEHDFDVQKKGIARNIDLVQQRLASEAIDGLKRDGSSMGDRLILIDGLVLADASRNELGTTAKKLLKTAASLREANEKLATLIVNDKITVDEIKTFADDAKDLPKAIKPFVQ